MDYRTQQNTNSVFSFGISLIFIAFIGSLIKETLKTTVATKYLPAAKEDTVTVVCPICGEVIKISRYNHVTRTDALKRHIEMRHPRAALRTQPQLKSLPQVTVEGGEPVSPKYRYLTGWVSEPLPDYSLATDILPAVEVEAGERKIDAVMKQLKEGVEKIQQSENFRQFLWAMSRFHDYSIGNLILISAQKPDATYVAGFNTWKELGRWVKKGEKGISIIAPVMPPRPRCSNCGERIPKNAKYCPGCGIELEEEKELEITPAFFKVVYVFDISQTEGKPLPEYQVPVLTGEANEKLFSMAMALAKAQGLTVSFEPKPDYPPTVKGEYTGKTIWIKPDEPRAQQLKTLLHELAHHYSEYVFQIPRHDAETIAESAAFVVGAHFGFDSGVRAFPYVALWAQDKKVLERNLTTIRNVAGMMIEAMEKNK